MFGRKKSVHAHGRKYGHVEDRVDKRDFRYSARMIEIKESVDLTSMLPESYDQGTLGSCVGNGVAAAHQFCQQTQASKSWIPSRLMIYRGAREIEGTINEDAGCMIRDAVKYVARAGVCPEAMWPYDEKKFATEPAPECLQNAAHNRVLAYYRVPQSRNAVLGCLSEGYPIVFGTELFPSFESEEVAKSGKIPMPGLFEKTIGGHCMLAVGFRTFKAGFFNRKVTWVLVRNSWSKRWGLNGSCWMPLDYLLGHWTSDMWTLRLVEVPA